MRLWITLFIVAPLVELALLLRVSEWIGGWPTMGLVLVTGAVGGALAHHQGTRALRDYLDATSRGELPAGRLLDAFLIFIAGALLLTPGLISDVVGLWLLFPLTRSKTRKLLSGWLQSRFDFVVATETTTRASSRVVEAELDEESSLKKS